MPALMLKKLFHLPAMDDFPGPFAHRAGLVSRELRELWERTSRDAAATRKIEELHATREAYRALLKGHLLLLEDYLSVAELHQLHLGPPSERVSELRRAEEGLRELHDELFPRWQTLDDLHAILAQKFTLSAAKLDELAAKSPPPQSWFDETLDPFTAE